MQGIAFVYSTTGSWIWLWAAWNFGKMQHNLSVGKHFFLQYDQNSLAQVLPFKTYAYCNCTFGSDLGIFLGSQQLMKPGDVVRDREQLILHVTLRYLPLSILSLKQAEVSLPLVTHDLPTREAPDWDDHCWSPGHRGNVNSPVWIHEWKCNANNVTRLTLPS